MMKHILVHLLSLIVAGATLTACGAAPQPLPYPSPVSPDSPTTQVPAFSTPLPPNVPGTLVAGQAESAATLQAAAGTATEVANQVQAATAQAQGTYAAWALSVTQTASALDASQRAGEATATANALSALQTSTAQADAWAATVQVQNATATARAVEIVQTAQARVVAQEQTSAERTDMFWGMLSLVTMVFSVAFGALVLVLFTYAVVTVITTWSAPRRVVETSNGPVLVNSGLRGPVIVEALPRAMSLLGDGSDDDETLARRLAVAHGPTQTSQFVVRSHGQVTSVYRQPDDPKLEEDRRACLRLLRAAMLAEGTRSNRIPGYRDLGMSADTWSRARKLLAPYVEAKGGKGTFLIGRYQTLGELYEALVTRRISPVLPSPTPPPDEDETAASVAVP